MTTFNDFVHKHNLTKEATSNKKIYPALSSLGLNDVDIYPRDEPFSSDIGIVNLHPSRATHWIVYINETYSDSYGCAPPNKLFKFNKKINKQCLYSEYKKQSLTGNRDSYCASYCVNIIQYSNRIVNTGDKSCRNRI